MYWQARFEQEDPNQDIIHEMHKMRKTHKDFSCLRMTHEVSQAGYLVNKKKVDHLMKENGLNVTSNIQKLRKYSSYRGDTGKPRRKLLHRRFYTSIVHQRSRRTRQNSSIMKETRPANYVRRKSISTRS